jgi:hypothetical protein
VGKAVKFISNYVAPNFTIPSGNIGTVEDYPGFDQGGSADQPDIENGVLKIKVKDNSSPTPISRVVGIQIDQLATFVQDVPLGTPVS